MMRSLFITLLAAIALLNKRADAAGTLVLTVADSQTIPNNADTVVTIALANPTASQAAVTPTIVVSLEGAAATFAIPSAAMTGTVLGTQTTFTTATIAESATTGTAASNTITFTLRPVKALVATQKITIAGLTGSGTGDSGTLAVAGTDAAKVGSAGVWTQTSGTLVLTVAGSQTIPNNADTVVTIALTNPAASQAAVTPTIAASVEGATSAFGIASAAMVAPSASSGGDSGGDSGGSSDDNTGAIVGGVIGGLVVVAIVVYLVMNQKKNQNKVSASA